MIVHGRPIFLHHKRLYNYFNLFAVWLNNLVMNNIHNNNHFSRKTYGSESMKEKLKFGAIWATQTSSGKENLLVVYKKSKKQGKKVYTPEIMFVLWTLFFALGLWPSG